MLESAVKFVQEAYFSDWWIGVPMVVVSLMLAVLAILRLADRFVDDKTVGLNPLEGCLWDNGVRKIRYVLGTSTYNNKK